MLGLVEVYGGEGVLWRRKILQKGICYYYNRIVGIGLERFSNLVDLNGY